MRAFKRNDKSSQQQRLAVLQDAKQKLLERHLGDALAPTEADNLDSDNPAKNDDRR